MTAEIHKMPEPKPRLHCAKCGMTATAACDCGVGYITAVKWAAQAVKANPAKSDRAIAEDSGVSDKTVAKARRQAGAEKSAPEKRTGRDGKNYTAKRKSQRRETPVADRALALVMPLVEQDLAINSRKLGAEHGISHVEIESAIARARALVDKRADPDIDPATLSKSARERFDAAIRQHKKNLDAQFEHRVIDGIRERMEHTVLPSYNRKRIEWERVVKARTGIMSKAEYRLIERCLHPDNTASAKMRSEAFQFFRSLKLVLLSEDEAPTEPFKVPTVDEAMRQKT